VSAADLLSTAAIGLVIGFLGGLFGKGGSAIATPLLAAIGVPPIAAVASPLPATIPSTLAAGRAYARERMVDWTVVRWSIACGVPATFVGSIATRWIDGSALVAATDVVLVGIGLRFALTPRKRATRRGDGPRTRPVLLAAVAVTVGLAAGLLANSGGFLLAPLYVTVLRLPIKRAFASSLTVASVLAVPGSLTHIALGHMDWAVVGVIAATSVPLSFLGARVALRTDAERLERLYGAGLTVLGVVFLATR
jgi:uncharacterized membrane protein YfcA